MSNDTKDRVRASGDVPDGRVLGPDVVRGNSASPAVAASWREALQFDPIVVGGIAVALILGNTAILKLPLSVPLLLAAGAGATLIYGLDRWPALSPEDRWAHPHRVAWMRRHTTWLRAERVACVALVVTSAFFLELETVVVASGFAVLGVLHVTPVWPGRRRLKTFGWGRRVSVACVWAMASVVLPLLEAQTAFDLLRGSAFVDRWAGGSPSPGIVVSGWIAIRYLVVWANVALIDWADGPAERRAGIKTYPESSASVIRGRAVGAALTAAAGIVGVGVYSGLSPLLVGVEAVGAVGMAGLLWTLRPQTTAHHRLILDLAVAWPLVTFIVAQFQRL